VTATLSRRGICALFSFLLMTIASLGSSVGQDEPDRLTAEENEEYKRLLDATLKAKPGTSPLNLADAAIKRQFDLTGRVVQYELLRLNRSMMEKKYAHGSEFVANYMSRHGKLFDEKARSDWLLAYASQNQTEKSFFDRHLGKSGLQGEKRKTVVLGYYHLPRPYERVFYIELVSLIYKDGVADFSALPKRAKDWIATHNDLFP
jgi:hypothetical protein